MKKVTKAAVAAAAAGALLLGGAGTFALWNDTVDVNAGAVTTGHLTMSTDGTGTWADISIPAAPTGFAPATDLLVPGDIVEFTQDVTIEATGKNLKAKLSNGALTGGTPLPADVSVDVAVDDEDSVAGLIKEAETGVLTFTGSGTYTVPVKVKVTFAESATASMDAPVTLGNLTLTLDQVR